jgi:hypothetical protein
LWCGGPGAGGLPVFKGPFIPKIEAKITAITAINTSIFHIDSKTQVKITATAGIFTSIFCVPLTYGKTSGAAVRSAVQTAQKRPNIQ